MRVRNWQQALDLHIDFAKFLTSERGWEFTKRNQVVATLAGFGVPLDEIKGEPDEKVMAALRGVTSAVDDDVMNMRALSEAPTYFLSEEMQVVIEAAMSDPAIGEFTLDVSDPMTPSGVLWFPNPLVIDQDVAFSSRGHTSVPEPLQIMALGWSSTSSGVTIHPFIKIPNGVPALDGVSVPTAIIGQKSVTWEYGKALDDLREVNEIRKQWVEILEREVEEGNEAVLDERRWIAALWLIIRQKLPAVEQVHPSGQFRKRMLRSCLGPDHEIKVITLRRRKSPWRPSDEEGGLDRVYTHRWLVAGFWRNQYYPSLGGPARLPDGSQDPANHRPKRIGDYIAGPEHLPLVLKDTVYKVVR